jgi:hypothetical protein
LQEMRSGREVGDRHGRLKGDFACCFTRRRGLAVGGPRGRLGVRGVCARSHRDDGILALLVIRFWEPEQQLVLLNPELGLFSNSQELWMFFVPGPDPVNYRVRLEHILLAQQVLGVLVLPVGAQDFAL